MLKGDHVETVESKNITPEKDSTKDKWFNLS
jgi:hypothetical protein